MLQTNSGRISEADFVKFLLKNGKLTPKKRAQMQKKVEKIWPSKGRGVSLPSFRVKKVHTKILGFFYFFIDLGKAA